MHVDCALICDYVTVREGLLHVLGGGVSRIWRTAYPGPLGAGLALRIVVHPSEFDADHKIAVLLNDDDGHKLAEIGSDFHITPEMRRGIEPGEEFAVNMPLNLPMIAIPRVGDYVFDILIDGQHQRSVPFKAKAGPAPSLPFPRTPDTQAGD